MASAPTTASSPASLVSCPAGTRWPARPSATCTGCRTPAAISPASRGWSSRPSTSTRWPTAPPTRAARRHRRSRTSPPRRASTARGRAAGGRRAGRARPPRRAAPRRAQQRRLQRGARGERPARLRAVGDRHAVRARPRGGRRGEHPHLRPGGYRTFRFTRSRNGWTGEVAPLYYGLLAFARAAPAGARLVQTSQPS